MSVPTHQPSEKSQVNSSSLMPEGSLENLLSETYTKAQLLRRFRVLKDFVNFRLFNLTAEQLNLPLNSQVELFLALHQKDIIELNLLRQEGSWLTNLGEEFFKQFNLDNQTLIYQSIEQYIQKINPIIVYLPLDLPEKDILELGSWFKKNISLTTLFEVQFDSNLIGGCALSYKGIYKDLSLRARISDDQAQIIASLKEFKK